MSREAFANFDLEMLRQAYKVAAESSTDPSTQNGAVLVDMHVADPRPLAWGANHFPRGVEETPTRWERPLKYQYVEHAERNCIYHAARHGVRTLGLVMYCPWAACDNCARAIIQAGIREVVGHKAIFDMTPIHWKDSIKIALEMFDEAGVGHRLVDGVVGVATRFNGQLVSF